MSVLLRFEFDHQDRTNPNRKCSVWENTYLIKAKSPGKAYDKGVDVAKADQYRATYRGKPGGWKYIGIYDIIPVYEKLKDGSEIFWTDWGKRSVKASDERVRRKQDLIKSISQVIKPKL